MEELRDIEHFYLKQRYGWELKEKDKKFKLYRSNFKTAIR
jgi:hypothetical protein